MNTLYDTYRPRRFEDVVGQDAVVKSLKGVVAKGTNRSVLLAGPSGTGKTTLARIAAATLGFQVQEIDAATFTGIDAMRDVMKALKYKPLDASKGKVLIVDECHRLSGAAVDSMLKEVEEPAEWVRWFFCTTDPTKLAPALKTRVTTYTLKPVPTPVLFDLLDRVAAKEKVLDTEVGGKILNLCAKEANGSPRQALVNLTACMEATTLAEARELLDKVEVESAEAVDLARALIGGKNWQQIAELLKVFKDKEAEGVRNVVRAYATTVALSNAKPSPRVLKTLEAFCKPFYYNDGKSPLVLACAEVVFGA